MNLWKTKTGWIGMDAGTSQLKVAQVVRDRQGLRVKSAAILPLVVLQDLEKTHPGDLPVSSGVLRAVRQLLPNLKGRSVAATVSASRCQIVQVPGAADKTASGERGVRRAVEATTGHSYASQQYAAWPAEQPSSSHCLPKTNVLSVPDIWTDQLYGDITRAAWHCRVIDGPPFAIARAVTLSHTAQPASAWAALDFGYSQATFYVVSGESPVYVRCLKDCSLQRLLGTVSSALGGSESEAMQLLLDHGVLPDSENSVGKMLGELLSAPLADLVSEIERTINHLRNLRRSIAPAGVDLFGGGATLPGLGEFLSSKLDLEFKPWHCPELESNGKGASGLPLCMLGPAISLSALGWGTS